MEQLERNARLKAAIMAALNSTPGRLTASELAIGLEGEEFTSGQVAQRLIQMKKDGMVRNEDGIWSLATGAAAEAAKPKRLYRKRSKRVQPSPTTGVQIMMKLSNGGVVAMTLAEAAELFETLKELFGRR